MSEDTEKKTGGRKPADAPADGNVTVAMLNEMLEAAKFVAKVPGEWDFVGARFKNGKPETVTAKKRCTEIVKTWDATDRQIVEAALNHVEPSAKQSTPALVA